MSFTSNPWESSEGSSKYALTVNDQQTIQQVIDSIPVMAGSLASGITNPYIVSVPPGHEKEYYSLVRDASDAASDKRNVKVVFEDNPEGIFKIDLFNSCESLDEWDSSTGNLSLLSGVFSAGTKGIRCVTPDPSTIYVRYSNYDTETYDWRKYQGILIDVKLDKNELTSFRFQIFDAAGNIYSSIPYFSSYKGTIFVPFYDLGGESATVLDFSAITKFYITSNRKTGYTGDITVDFDNIRLIRTTPTNVAILRFDDGMNEHWETQKYLMDKGYRGCYVINNPMACLAGADIKIAIKDIQQMQANGNDIINHLISISNINNYSDIKVLYEYKAMRKFLNKYGLNKAAKIFINPGGTSSSTLEACLLEHGVYSAYQGYGGFPAAIAGIDTPSATIQGGAEAFFLQKRGGILQLMMHEISGTNSYEDFQDFLAWVETNFSEIIVFSDMVKLLPPGMNNKQEYSNSGAKVFRKDTLTGDGKVYFFDEVLNLDPGGSNRDILPIDAFSAGQTLEIVNTADAAETLTFDPLFSSSGTHDGADNADILTDSSEVWITGHLIGRTINNTTDGSSGLITNNSGNHTITAILSGGTDNNWDIGDTYTITPVGSDQDITQGNSATFVYDGEGWH